MSSTYSSEIAAPGGKAWGGSFWDDVEQIELKSFLSVSYEAQATSATSGFLAATIEANTSTRALC